MIQSVLLFYIREEILCMKPIFSVKESGLILLQTIPNHINVESITRELMEVFPGIINIHELHVWQLSGENIISTVHIVFLDPTVNIISLCIVSKIEIR